MEYKDIKDLMKYLNSSNLKSFEMKNKDIYLKIEKQDDEKKAGSNITEIQEEIPEDNEAEEYEEYKKLEEPKHNEKKADNYNNIKVITSPIVGTFYGSPSPDKEAFVKAGDKVKKGDTVCIIEAMKLMNDIQSDIDGEIVEVCVKDEDMVEYGQSLFKVKIN